MEPIIASLGLTQLKKLDSLINQRKEIYDELNDLIALNTIDKMESDVKDVYTHAVFRFKGNDIFTLIEKFKKDGLLLRATWPTHQRLWENQNTENILRIAREILIWNVNPNVTSQEIEKFIHIVSDINSKAVSKNVMPVHQTVK